MTTQNLVKSNEVSQAITSLQSSSWQPVDMGAAGAGGRAGSCWKCGLEGAGPCFQKCRTRPADHFPVVSPSRHGSGTACVDQRRSRLTAETLPGRPQPEGPVDVA